MVLIVVSCSFEPNGSISRPSHQSTAIGKDGVGLESICDKDALECIILYFYIMCSHMNYFKYTTLLEQFSDHFQLNNVKIIVVIYLHVHG
jgi:hypothetical protein